MALFLRMDPDRETLASLGRHLGQRPRVLAWGRTTDGVAVGLPDRLVYNGPEQWMDQLWHRVARGAWNRSTSTLRWSSVEGASQELTLTRPGRLPELFNERVSASIVLQRLVDLPPRGSAQITLRRDLGDPHAALMWSVLPQGRARLDEPEAQAVVAAELARLRAEYDIG